MNIRRASIIPLDYTRPHQKTRKEHSITYVSTNWDQDLTELLIDPVHVLGCLQMDWPQVFTSSQCQDPVDWKLLSPVNARLEYLFKAPLVSASVLTVGYAFGAPIPALHEKALSSAEPFEQSLLSGIIDWFNTDPKGREILICGFFFAEFAPNTSALNIRYSPPGQCIKNLGNCIKDPTGKPARARMNGPFTRATLGLLSPTVPSPGTVHFDIGSSQEDRALFIMDHLENSARTCQILNQGALEDIGNDGDGQIYMTRLNLVPDGSPITMSNLTLGKRERDFNIVDKTVLPELQWDAVSATNASVMPTMSVEGLSTPTDTYVCGQGLVCEMGNYVLQDLNLKDYIPPVPPPGG